MKLITYFIVLEKHCDLKGQKEVSGLVAKISRAIGTPSPSLLPPNVPRWALMRESMLYICFFLHFNFVGITTEDQENNQENEQVSS